MEQSTDRYSKDKCFLDAAQMIRRDYAGNYESLFFNKQQAWMKIKLP